ncbi:MAG: hypothetical protein LBH21_07610 [Gracilibacteraceae bacterium]|jgi:hypothetical protein|nr:hypothetical protein [Gracilibacteraceae bacterium]
MQSGFIIAVAAFFAFVLLIYMPLTYLSLYLKDRKGRTFAQEHNAIKFYVKTNNVGGHLSVLGINGKKPVIHRNMKLYGYYLSPGKNIIQVQYQYQPVLPNFLRKILGLTYEYGIKQYRLEAEELTITVKPKTEYILYYDHSKDDYAFEEVSQL